MRDAKIWTFAVPMGTVTVEGSVYAVDIIHGDKYYQLVDSDRHVSLVPAKVLEQRLYNREQRKKSTP